MPADAARLIPRTQRPATNRETVARATFVLVLEEDRDLRDLLRFTFERAGFGVLLEPDGDGPPHQVVLVQDDLVGIVSGLRSGARLLHARSRYRLLPIIEVAKPFSPRDLVLRVRAHVLA
jgi:DNA-binding response OmpR family regulator